MVTGKISHSGTGRGAQTNLQVYLNGTFVGNVWMGRWGNKASRTAEAEEKLAHLQAHPEEVVEMAKDRLERYEERLREAQEEVTNLRIALEAK